MNISKVAGRLICPSVYIVCFRDGNIVVSSKIKKRGCEEMNPHFFTAPFYFAFIWFKVQGSGFRVEVAASPPFFRWRATLENPSAPPLRHPERSRGIFTVLWESACCAEGKRCPGTASHQAMSVLQERFLDFARNDDAREALSKLRGASIFLCAAPSFRISHF